MGRKKRIPYDPPHLRSGRKRRSGPPVRPEQAMMTRRMLLSRGAVVTAFSLLAGRLGYMQVLEGERYRSEAVQNIRQDETLKPTRGIIYDRKQRELAVNRETWEVRVLPGELPDRRGRTARSPRSDHQCAKSARRAHSRSPRRSRQRVSDRLCAHRAIAWEDADR